MLLNFKELPAFVIQQSFSPDLAYVILLSGFTLEAMVEQMITSLLWCFLVVTKTLIRP